MNIYEELTDLYNFDEVTAFNPTLHKSIFTIENELYKGDSFTTPEGKNVFVFRTAGTMGNHWSLYSITDNKYLITGRRTKKLIIEEAGRL
jgi:hypothetical protein